MTCQARFVICSCVRNLIKPRAQQFFAFRKFANAYAELHAKMVGQLRAHKPKTCTSPSVARMCKALKGSKAPPRLRVKVKDKNGQDRFITQPEQVDEAAIAAWEPIHAGNVSAQTEQLLFSNLQASFGVHVLQQEPHSLKSITGS